MAEQFDEKIKIKFDEETGDISVTIDCPFDENSSFPAFGAFGYSPEAVFEEIQRELKKEGVEIEIVLRKDFVRPDIKDERNKLLKIISKRNS
ncbi:MAG: hypothetical protein U9P90_02435 [Patescibacteria group bacterium]|nr:hypothetical protein [Patescibacteria group bacterium]